MFPRNLTKFCNGQTVSHPRIQQYSWQRLWVSDMFYVYQVDSFLQWKPTRCNISQIYFDKELCMFRTDLRFFIEINLRNSSSRWLLLQEYIPMNVPLIVKLDRVSSPYAVFWLKQKPQSGRFKTQSLVCVHPCLTLKKFYVLPTHYVCVFCVKYKKNLLFPYTALTDCFL